MTAYWSVPRCFAGQTVAVLASGPSLSSQAVEEVSRLPCIAVNNTHRLAPWAWALYAADDEWWAHPSNADAHAFAGHRVTVGEVPGTKRMRNTGRSGYDPDPRSIRTGGNSGYQALHLALHTGASTVLLLGFDMHGAGHWHGKHAWGLRETAPATYQGWIVEFRKLAAQLPSGVRVLNCSPDSALDAFRRTTLAEALDVNRALHA
jgi:hypothetical protein